MPANEEGGSAVLSFTIANVSPSETITLERITTDVGTVDVEPTPILPLTVLVSAPEGTEDPLELELITVTIEGLKMDLREGIRHRTQVPCGLVILNKHP